MNACNTSCQVKRFVQLILGIKLCNDLILLSDLDSCDILFLRLESYAFLRKNSNMGDLHGVTAHIIVKLETSNILRVGLSFKK